MDSIIKITGKERIILRGLLANLIIDHKNGKEKLSETYLQDIQNLQKKIK